MQTKHSKIVLISFGSGLHFEYEIQQVSGTGLRFAEQSGESLSKLGESCNSAQTKYRNRNITQI